MDVMEALLTRRSIRKYQDRQVEDQTVKDIIRAGCYAPSAVDKRPWEFMVLRERKTMEGIIQVHPHAKMLLQAPCAILICGVPDRAHTPDYLPLDLSAAMQNMLLAAHGLGLGACWLGVFPRQERVSALRHLLHIPSDILPFALMALGYPAEVKEATERFNERLLHFEKW